MASREELVKALRAAKARAANMREKGEKAVGQIVESAEVTGSAFLMGYLRGRVGDNGELKVAGVDVDLAAGSVALGLGLLEAFGKNSSHVANVGNGLLACFLTHKGVQWGIEGKAKAGTSGPQALPRPRMSATSGSVFNQYSRVA